MIIIIIIIVIMPIIRIVKIKITLFLIEKEKMVLVNHKVNFVVLSKVYRVFKIKEQFI